MLLLRVVLNLENKGSSTDIAVIFLKEGIKKKEASPMTGVDCHTIKSGSNFIKNYLNLGIKDFLVFPSTEIKSFELALKSGIVKKFISKVKKKFGKSINIYADVGLSPYTKNGHSVIIDELGNIEEKKSYNIVSKLAVCFGKAGADYVCPCLSLKSQVKNVRNALDKECLNSIKIMDYSTKFSSTLYGPYRKVVQSKLSGNCKKSYQTDYKDPEKALNQLKIAEKNGASIIIVKPGMLYLDVIYRARKLTKLPLAVYHISGEYMAFKLTAQNKMFDEKDLFDELHTSFERCGVDYLIGYAPDHFLRWNNEKN